MQKSQLKARLASMSDHEKTRLKIALGYEGLRAVGWHESIEVHGEPSEAQRQALDCMALYYAQDPAQDWEATHRARKKTWDFFEWLLKTAAKIKREQGRGKRSQPPRDGTRDDRETD